MSPPAGAAAPAVRRASAAAPGRPLTAPRRPRRVSGPSRRPRRVAERASLPERGLALDILRAAKGLPHARLDRLIRGRSWIALIAFALIGIVALQLMLLKLNAGIGRSLELESSLQRQNAALSIESSEMAAGNRVETRAAALGMELVPVGSLRFLAANPRVEAARAASALSARTRTTSSGSEQSSTAGAGATSEQGTAATSGSSSEAAGATSSSGEAASETPTSSEAPAPVAQSTAGVPATAPQSSAAPTAGGAGEAAPTGSEEAAGETGGAG
jgi:hypothetical protein